MDQKSVVKSIVDTTSLSHQQAMEVLGVICEQNQTAYIEGYKKGFNDAYIQKQEVPTDFITL